MFAKFLQETCEQQHAAGSFFSQQLDFQDPGFGGFQGQARTRVLKCIFWNISITIKLAVIHNYSMSFECDGLFKLLCGSTPHQLHHSVQALVTYLI